MFNIIDHFIVRFFGINTTMWLFMIFKMPLQTYAPRKFLITSTTNIRSNNIISEQNKNNFNLKSCMIIINYNLRLDEQLLFMLWIRCHFFCFCVAYDYMCPSSLFTQEDRKAHFTSPYRFGSVCRIIVSYHCPWTILFDSLSCGYWTPIFPSLT